MRERERVCVCVCGKQLHVPVTQVRKSDKKHQTCPDLGVVLNVLRIGRVTIVAHDTDPFDLGQVRVDQIVVQVAALGVSVHAKRHLNQTEKKKLEKRVKGKTDGYRDISTGQPQTAPAAQRKK